jgi:hypothetical protein
MRTLFVVILLAGVARAEDAPSYEKVIDPMLKKYCAGCHGPRMGRAGYDVTDHETLFKSKRGKVMLVAGQPEKSLLLTTMTGARGKRMPPRKETLQPTKQEIEALRVWIKAGAKDN